MVQHRCSRCKEDVGEGGIRHKYAGGLICEPCMRSLGMLGGGVRSFWSGLWSSFWDLVTDAVFGVFHPRTRRVAFDKEVRVAYSVQKDRVRDMPPDASISVFH